MHATRTESSPVRSPISMESLSATQFGSHRHVLEFESQDDIPQDCGINDVRIRVIYAELNPVDLQKLRGGSREGQEIPTGQMTVGYGGSGIIEDMGSNVPKDWIGKRVAFLCDPGRPGSYATQVVVDSRLVAPIPFQVSLRQAATVPVAGCTAYESLLKLGLGNLAPLRGNDPTLLIVGGAGGVGSWATQLARVLYPNLKIIVTASSAESKNWCRQMGATQVIQHDDITLQLEGGREGSVDYVLCLAEPTKELFGAITEVIRPYGTICLVVAGESIKSLDLGFAFFKAATVTTETVFSSIRTDYAFIQPASEIEDLLEHLVTDTIRAPLSPQLDSLAGSDDWKQALQDGGILDALASGHTRGKLVMKIGSDD